MATEDIRKSIAAVSLFTGTTISGMSGSYKKCIADTTCQFNFIDMVWNTKLKAIHAKALAAVADQDEVWNVQGRLMLRVRNVLYVGQELHGEFSGTFDRVIKGIPHLFRFYIPPSASVQEVMEILRDNLLPITEINFTNRDLAALARVFRTHMRGGDDNTYFLADFLTSAVFLVEERISGSAITHADLSNLYFRRRMEITTTCSICLEDFEDSTEIETPCKHTFHYLCLKTWLQKNYTSPCPICRATFSKEYLKIVFTLVLPDL